MQLISPLRSRYFRLAFIALASIYVMFSIGVIKATHLCMGREQSVTYFSSEAEACGCSLFDMEGMNSCCDDQYAVLKVDDKQKVIQAYTIKVPQLFVLEDLYTERLITSVSPRFTHPSAEDWIDTSPPTHLYQNHCSLVFYDSEFSV